MLARGTSFIHCNSTCFLKFILGCMCLLITSSILGQNFAEIDTSFNIGSSQRIISVEQFAQQKDGKIVVSGQLAAEFPTGKTINLARLNYDGSFDPAFTFELHEKVLQLGVDEEQRILVATNKRFIRLFPNGALDATFNSEAKIVEHFVILASGKIVIVDYRISRRYISRLKPDGNFDTTFTELERGPVMDLKIHPDGGILAPSYNPAGSGFVFLKLLPDGEINSNFFSPLNSPNHINHVSISQDGMIYYVFGDAFIQDERIGRCFPNGSIDSSFTAPHEMTFNCVLDTSEFSMLICKVAFTGCLTTAP